MADAAGISFINRPLKYMQECVRLMVFQKRLWLAH